MADDVTLPGTGAVVATDDDGTRHWQWTKAAWGPDGTFNKVDIASGKPLPVQLRDSDGTDVALSGKVGGLTETAPATDTASSGLNGRLQRITQRITSLIALLPTALVSGALKVMLHDGTNAATIKAASTAPVAADPAVVVAISPNSVNANGPASAANSAPVTASTEDVARVGIITETAPATDTASSGLNGRLQRIAQRITSLIALFPSALGQQAAASSLPVVISDYGKTVVKSITMTADTAILASGEIIADTQQLDAAFRVTDGSGILQSISIIEADAQGAAYTIYFLKTSTTFGSENGAPSISDANIAAGYLGHVDVGTGDFKTLNGAKVANIRNIGLPIKAVSGTDDLYIAIVNGTGTPTYAGGTIDLLLGIQQD